MGNMRGAEAAPAARWVLAPAPHNHHGLYRGLWLPGPSEGGSGSAERAKALLPQPK